MTIPQREGKENVLKHTPTPWKYTGDEDGDFVIWGAGDKDNWIANVGGVIQPVGSIDPQEKANAEFIVKAVNSHESLIQLLKSAHEIIEVNWTHNDSDLNKYHELREEWLASYGKIKAE